MNDRAWIPVAVTTMIWSTFAGAGDPGTGRGFTGGSHEVRHGRSGLPNGVQSARRGELSGTSAAFDGSFARWPGEGVAGMRFWGVPVAGSGRANWHFLRYGGYKWGVRFVPRRTGMLDRVALPWRSVGTGYGQGDGGDFTVEIQGDDRATYFPDGVALARAKDQRPGSSLDGYWEVPLTIEVEAFRAYHVVITNTHAQPSRNWSSANTLMSEVFLWPSGPGPRAEVYAGGRWSPWSSVHGDWSTANSENGSHVALLWRYAHGAVWEGLPYQSAAGSSGGSPFRVYGSRKFGEQFFWDEDSVVVQRVSASIRKQGSPRGPLLYRIERVDGEGPTAAGVLCTPDQTTPLFQVFREATLSPRFRLEKGVPYRFYVEAPGGTDNRNHYVHRLVYTFNEDRAIALSFGGRVGQAVYDVGAGWVRSGDVYDFGFLLFE